MTRKVKYYAGCLPWHDTDREQYRNIMDASGVHVPLPDIAEGAVPMPCCGCQMDLSVGPMLQAKMREVPDMEPICPRCHSIQQRFSGEAAVIENVAGDTRYVICSCGGLVTDGRCNRCWKGSKVGQE